MALSAPVLDAALDDGWALDQLAPKPVRLASVPGVPNRRSMTDVDDGWGLEDPIVFASPPKVRPGHSGNSDPRSLRGSVNESARHPT